MTTIRLIATIMSITTSVIASVIAAVFWAKGARARLLCGKIKAVDAVLEAVVLAVVCSAVALIFVMPYITCDTCN